jgi:hypothetical protein
MTTHPQAPDSGLRKHGKRFEQDGISRKKPAGSPLGPYFKQIDIRIYLTIVVRALRGGSV